MYSNSSGQLAAGASPSNAAIDTERLALGALIVGGRWQPEVFRRLHPNDFLDSRHRAVYSVFLAQNSSSLAFDLPLAAAELKDRAEFQNTDPGEFLLALGEAVATDANASYYAAQVRDASLKRRLASIAETSAAAANNGHSANDVLRRLLADLADYQRDAEADKSRFVGISAADFATSKYQQQYLVDRVLVAAQPCIIGGPKKALKTGTAVDLALSLATGGRFLGKFPVFGRHRVLLCSGESGLATLQETAQRVCRGMDHELSAIDGLTISESLPRISIGGNLAEFGRFLDDVAPEVVILDPLYRMHTGEGAENIYRMGSALADLGELCLSHGATPIVCHHLKSSRMNPHEPADLDDLAYSGCAEYFRQWLLLSRREPYEAGSGVHNLWLTVGGSAGHNSLWAIDVDEGTADAPGGRRWDISVQRADEARDAAKQRKADSKAKAQAANSEQQVAEDKNAIVRLMNRNADGLTQNKIKELCGVPYRRMLAAFRELCDDGSLVDCRVKVGNKIKPQPGYRLASEGQPIPSPLVK